jgi:hypothetical protein
VAFYLLGELLMTSRHCVFDLFLRSASLVLARHHGQAFADEVIGDARAEYERVLPEVPCIGGIRNVFQPVMTVNGWIVALHRAMSVRGKEPEDAIRVCQEVFDGWLHKLPDFVLQVIGRLLSAPVRWYFERQARRSQERRYAEDFVWRVERGPDSEMSLVFDECAVNKWYDAQGVRELKPYCNFVDVTYSRLMGMGVDATETIGLGCDQCALRYKHRRETVVPPNLQGIIPTGSDR